MNATVIPLSQAQPRHGAKAAALGDMLRASFPAPDGLVLAWDDGADIAAIAEVARERAAARGWATVAVRSSARDEDLATGSAAGRYTTVLGVPTTPAGATELRRAVVDVADSMGASRGGVIVQEMVRADASGVAFTLDPVTGARSVVVNAVPGLGDRFVSGEFTPRAWSVPRSDDGASLAVTDTDPGDPIDADTLGRLVEAALAIEQHFGAPQDIEWAVDASGLHLLQSRPITALEEQRPPADLEVPPGYWTRDVTHSRLPRTPLTLSVFDENPAFASTSVRFGVLAHPVGRRIRGWDYATIIPVGAPEGAQTGPQPPAWMLGTLIRLTTSGRRTLRAARRAQRDDDAGTVFREWHANHAPEFRRTIARLRDIDMSGTSDAELRDAVQERAAFVRRGLEVHFMAGMPYILALARLVAVCRTRLGWSEQRTWELLAGLSDATSEPAAVLRGLAALPPGSPEYDAALAHFQRVHGCRALDLELAEPTLAETPELLAATVERFTRPRRGADEEAEALRNVRAERAAEARAALSGRDRAVFDAALGEAERVYPLRDDNVFLTVDAPLALLRYAALEAGTRLAERGVLERSDEVFYLEIDELLDELRFAGTDGVPRESARRRRAERAWAIANPGPESYGENPGGIPRFIGLTRAERTATEAMAFVGSSMVPPLSGIAPAEGEPLTGVAASAGKATGRACVVRSEADFGRIEAGDILVCPSTRPSWAVIFPHLAGIVADAGGSLSHPAIIAREYGIPAVVATVHATSVIADGDVITVDGSTGVVTRHG